MMEWYHGGMMEWWNDGMIEWWNDGMVEWWNDGMLEWLNYKIMELLQRFLGIQLITLCVIFLHKENIYILDSSSKEYV